MKIEVVYKGKTVAISVEPGSTLLEILRQQGIYISAACGGKGKCGKCKVQMVQGATKATAQEEEFFSQQELLKGFRLACLSIPQEDCRVFLETGDESDFEVVSEHQEKSTQQQCQKEDAYYIGIDIGTTTIAIELIGKTSGQLLNTVTTINRQRAYGADVISRIQAANDGQAEELKESIRNDLYTGIIRLLTESKTEPASVIKIAIAGNTTMGHLLMGYSCETLGVYPFTPVHINTIKTTFIELFWKQIQNNGGLSLPAEVVLLPGISTFVGADISAGMLCCGFDELDKPAMLIDLGTNGEMALGNRDKILVTSTAAGPAFEGGNISCGMGSVKGAICGVTMAGRKPEVATIGGLPPIGICGTGVIETVSELVKEELVDETGMLAEEYFEEGFVLAKTPQGEPIRFTQKDVREIQLAKAAVRAGVETLLRRYGITYQEVDQVFLAGGFGYKINLEKTMAIGMLPEEFAGKITAVGNSSLGGAAAYLTQPEGVRRLDEMVGAATEVELSADKDFNRFYTEYMFFE